MADKSNWQQVKALFHAALERSSDTRREFILKTCQDDAINEQVLQLLSYHESDTNFLQPLMGHSPEPMRPIGDSLLGLEVGEFELKRVLGSGGMGTVYEAVQASPHRRVALKILRLDIADDDMAQRMAREATILARLQHPGIAKVYAAGTLGSGNLTRPWFAMELIEGLPILEWVRLYRPNRQNCLELFLALCEAVQHAHHRNVIHRDLKPSNILVRTGSSQEPIPDLLGQPTVLDFGVAKIRGEKSGQTMTTCVGQVIGTLLYMSPEQFTGDSRLVDARADVFALGVIGFEMLTNVLPHDRQGYSVMELLQRLPGESPRHLQSVDSSFHSDLDIILAKSMERDVDQRYQSVGELSEDIRAYLEHRPIRARTPSLHYRLRKGLRRNRVLVGGVATTLLAMAIGLLAYQQQAKRATRMAELASQAALASQYEADKAKATNEFITNDFLIRLMESIQAERSSSEQSVADHATRAAENISTMFAGNPNLEAAVRNELGTIFYNLRAGDQSAEQFELALQLWEANRGPMDVDTLKAVNNLGQARMLQGRLDLAESLYRRALEGRLAILGDEHAATLVSMNNFADLMLRRKQFSEAEQWMRRALDQQIKLLGKQHKNTLTTMFNYGSLLIQSDQLDQALAFHREAYEISKLTLGDNHVMTLHGAIRLAQTMLRTGQTEPAFELLTTALPSFENLFGQQHPETIVPRRLLARLFEAKGDFQAAKQQLETVLAIANSAPAPRAQLIRQVQSDIERLGRD